jgi:hypothetical protein
LFGPSEDTFQEFSGLFRAYPFGHVMIMISPRNSIIVRKPRIIGHLNSQRNGTHRLAAAKRVHRIGWGANDHFLGLRSRMAFQEITAMKLFSKIWRRRRAWCR